ncbi:hypothetical protein HHI36_012771 [Cryptolaemus montrouzieri]|uniref:Uncharacterized protein n=1 Tax=Cryptolaemus montrouzieri TaxID=559131 RepID=A0ABD2NF79_9CUCU
MFGFFKRAKKETERSKEDKRGKDPLKGQSQEWQAIKAGEGSCKNTAKSESALEGNTQSLPNALSSSASVELRENCAVSDVARSNENCETNDFSCTNMNVKNTDQRHQMSYAGAVKIPEPRQSIKPCGHGTVAIVPRVPISGSKRENSSTPPASPKLEIKKFKERSNTTPDLHRLSDIAEKPDGPKNVTQITSSPGFSPKTSPKFPEVKEKNLINQEAKFQSELNDLTKQLSIRDAEANKLRFQMEELQRDVFAKSAGMDRLQMELQAANKESEMTKIRIRHLETDLVAFRENNARLTENLETKTSEHMEAENKAQAKIEELQEVIRQLKTKINWLEQQIESLKQEKAALEKQQEQIESEKKEEETKNKEALEQVMRQKNEIEAKWKKDFEKLRTINIMKEQDLLDDFEWKLREVQQNCKKRLEEKDKAMEERLLQAYKHAEEKMKEAEGIVEQLNSLKKYEVEVVKLRGLTEEQAQALRDLTEKQDQMKAAEASLRNEAQRLRKMIDMEKENLQHMQRIHHQELVDKERKLQQTLDEKRMEIAIYWEDKLLHEIGRLKDELEQIYTEEQHGALQKVRDEKERELESAKKEWEKKIKECSNEIEFLKRTMNEKECYFQDEIERKQTKTDQDILDLRRLMDKIDMTHHERFEKMVLEHERELENINRETEQRIKEVEFGWQQQATNLRKTLDMVKEQMEQESQHKIAMLIEKHRSELDQQWENLVKQKQEAVVLVENEYVSKYKALEENF